MIIETLVHGADKLEIFTDNDAPGPREWDNLSTMACFHSRYDLGDRTTLSREEAVKIMDNADDRHIVLPLYLYDHSGITINTSGFSCPWDSCKVGIVYVSKEKVRKEYGWKVITKTRKEKIIEYLRSEVQVYDQYLRGEVYGFTKYEDGEEVDSCGGFYGDDHKASGLLDQADWPGES